MIEITRRERKFRNKRTYCFDTIGVVNGKFGIVRGLDGFIDDSIDDTKGVELKLNSLNGSVGNLLILLIKVVEELRMLGQVQAPSGPNLLPGHSV